MYVVSSAARMCYRRNEKLTVTIRLKNVYIRTSVCLVLTLSGLQKALHFYLSTWPRGYTKLQRELHGQQNRSILIHNFNHKYSIRQKKVHITQTSQVFLPCLKSYEPLSRFWTMYGWKGPQAITISVCAVCVLRISECQSSQNLWAQDYKNLAHSCWH